MPGFRKWCLADPGGAFTPHLCERRRRPVHELSQVMAADASERAAALRHLSRGVMRAARAKVGRSGEWHHVATELRFLSLEESNALGNSGRGMKAGDALGNNLRDLRRC